MVSARKPGSFPVVPSTVPDAVFAKALRQMKTMTKAERVKSLKDAGIITAKGNYTKPYRLSGRIKSHATSA